MLPNTATDVQQKIKLHKQTIFYDRLNHQKSENH